jgi:peptide/nickel transport system permease protein
MVARVGEIGEEVEETSEKRIKQRIPVLALSLVSLFIFAVIFGPLIVPHDPFKTDLEKSIMPPVWQEGGSSKHLLGTDSMGRDILSRLIQGARITLFTSLVAIGLAGSIGVLMGLVSGFFGGKIDMAIMRVTDIFLSLPPIMMAIILASMLNPSLKTVILAIGLTAWTSYARLTRGEVLSLKEKDFVRLARVAGASNWRILFSHIFPNVVNTLIILVTLDIGRVIIATAALSFLGLGVQPPSAAWGLMLSEGRKYITYAWWLVTFPGIAILLTVLGFNLSGDWFRDILDPKQKLR